MGRHGALAQLARQSALNSRMCLLGTCRNRWVVPACPHHQIAERVTGALAAQGALTMPIRTANWWWHLGLLLVASSFLALPDSGHVSPAARAETQAEGGTQLNIGTPLIYEQPGERA